MTNEEAFFVKEAVDHGADVPLSQRLTAHSVLLREGVLAEDVVQQYMADAIADICIALTRIGGR